MKLQLIYCHAICRTITTLVLGVSLVACTPMLGVGISVPINPPTNAQNTASAAQKLQLANTTWQVISAQGLDIGKRKIAIAFDNDSKGRAYAGCNNIGFGYGTLQDSIFFSPLSSTKMACLEGMDAELFLGQTLPKVQKFSFDTKHHLLLLDKKGTLLITLKPIKATPVKTIP